MKTLLLTLTLLGGLAAAQTSIFNIPALPPGASAPAQSPSTPAPPTPAPTPAPAETPAPSTDLPTVTTLPAKGDPLKGEYAVSLTGPATVRAGEANTWSFNLSNSGSAPIHLEHGACDVRFEVLNAAGEVVRPDPQNAICTMQLVITDVAAGATSEVQKIRWEGKDSGGQNVPAGTYTIRAKFNGAGVFTPAATLQVTVQ